MFGFTFEYKYVQGFDNLITCAQIFTSLFLYTVQREGWVQPCPTFRRASSSRKYFASGANGLELPSGIGSVVNDALAVYFLDVIIASAFIARWYTTKGIEIVDGIVGSAMTTTHRIGVALHRTP
jgi:hypothetical protein